MLPVDPEKKVAIVKKILEKLNDIIQWFEKQSCLQFYASSILITYSLSKVAVDMRMIDFAHTFYEPDKPDENYLFGARNLRRDFEKSIQ